MQILQLLLKLYTARFIFSPQTTQLTVKFSQCRDDVMRNNSRPTSIRNFPVNSLVQGRRKVRSPVSTLMVFFFLIDVQRVKKTWRPNDQTSFRVYCFLFAKSKRAPDLVSLSMRARWKWSRRLKNGSPKFRLAHEVRPEVVVACRPDDLMLHDDHMSLEGDRPHQIFAHSHD